MPKPTPDPLLILASKSPRRRYLLEQAGLSFSVMPSNVDESRFPITDPEEYALTIASCKAAQIADRFKDSWVIGADTIVVVDGRVLGKPNSIDNAREMLRQLSGKMHQVMTGCAIFSRASAMSFQKVIVTDVHFKQLSKGEIEWYIQTKEPFDKAGAYAIQGIGTFLVKRINGSYTNVVGLPVCEVLEFLIDNGVANHYSKSGHHQG
jgi:septum formation protein